MADRQPFSARRPASTVASFRQKFKEYAPNSPQLLGFAALIVSGGILLFLTGLTLTAALLGLVFFSPIILITSPIWVPLGILIFITMAGFLSFLGLCIAVVAAVSWLYRYFRGFDPPGSGRVDYARTRIADTARRVKDYARGHGGYWQGRVKDAAPGA